MKKLLFIVLAFITLNSFSQDYLLADKNSDKTSVADFIKKAIDQKKLKENPVVVVNNKVLKKSELNQFNFLKSDILNMSIIAMDNTQMTAIYGEQSLNGVLLIDIKPNLENEQKTVPKNNILYFLNDTPITYKELSKINPNKIDSVKVIKNKVDIAKYSTQNYDGVIIVYPKK